MKFLCRFLIYILATQLIGPVSAQSAVHLDATPETLSFQVPPADTAYVLHVAGADGSSFRHEFSMGEPLIFDIFDDEGYRLADGEYRWELRGLAAGRSRHSEIEGTNEVSRRAYFSGGFTVQDGAFADPRLPEASAMKHLIGEDLSVVGRQCVGLGCSDPETFDSDTLRLKDPGPRLRFEDTSQSGSFAGNDWQLVANDLENGGSNRFSIEDLTEETVPFTLLAGAPDHSLVIDSGGSLGVGTSTPENDIHLIRGDTPTLRLEQDASKGFDPIVWDVAGNEHNFFIRRGSGHLPLRIRAGAASNSIYVHKDGTVGLGTDSPSAKLDVNGDVVVAGTINGRDLSADGMALDAHLSAVDNPHSVTAAQVGADPVGTAAAAIAAHEASHEHTANASRFGLVPAADFTTGQRAKATVTFATPFPAGTEYVVFLTATSTAGAHAYRPTAFDKTETGFRITLGSQAPELIEVSWMARAVTN